MMTLGGKQIPMYRFQAIRTNRRNISTKRAKAPKAC